MKRAVLNFMVMALALLFMASCGQSNGKKANQEAENTEITTKADSVVADDRGYIVKVGDMVPQFDLHLLDGTKVPVSSLKGKVVMLQFTASWCGVCRKEMPFIEKDIWLKLKENPDFALYGIDLKEDAETTAKFAEMIPVTYPITLDLEGKTFELFCAKGAGVTRNIILDREGRIIMLTRLFDEAEFNSMVETINAELARN
ncbi:MAG: TlpA family protein disulfide reductase [Bacteroidales bacterium]|nr:TlpA family protein disulfide reductase [Bacteroidales bacterium]